jgi:hypothetical protein
MGTEGTSIIDAAIDAAYLHLLQYGHAGHGAGRLLAVLGWQLAGPFAQQAACCLKSRVKLVSEWLALEVQS